MSDTTKDLGICEACSPTVTAMIECESMLRKQNDRLNRELPEMRKENQRLMAFLQDAAAYLRYHDQKPTRCTQAIMLQTLSHDIRGLASDEPCFVPQVSGYAKAEEEAQRRHDNAVRRP
jgi:hypothetical protein